MSNITFKEHFIRTQIWKTLHENMQVITLNKAMH